MKTWRVLKLLVKNIFSCAHLADTCTADQYVRKVSEDKATETWNCWCTCKCGKTEIPKTLTFDKAYLDQLRSAGVM